MNHDDPWSVSRRGFLGTASALALAAGVPGSAFAQGRTLRIASGEADGPNGTLDPALNNSDPDAARISLVFERLVVLDEGFTPQPQLAESWSTNETGDVWTIALKEGLLFSDGSPVTAEDVIFSYRRILDPAVGSPGAAPLSVLDPGRIIARDERTVEFGLNSAVVEFPLLIANRFTYIVKAGQTSEQLRLGGIGTGPFKVERFVPGEEPTVLVRNEHYWQDGLPLVDVVETRSISNSAAQIAAIAAGQIDLTWDLPRTGLAALEANPDVRVVSVRSPFVMSLEMQVDQPPFDDVRVRQALKAAIDREQFVQLVLGGKGTVGNDTPVAPWVQYAIPDPPPARDLDKARALLAEAGYADGLTIQLYTSEVVLGFIEMATVFAAQVAEAGVTVEIVKTPAEDYWANTWGKTPFFLASWSGRPADDALAAPYLSDADWNVTHWRRPDFDELLFTARRTLDEDARTALYHQAQRLVRDDGGAIIPFYADAVGAARANVTGWTIHPQKFSKNFAAVGFTD